MRDGPDDPVGEVERALSRVAGALDLPVSTFSAVPGSHAAKLLAEQKEAYLIAMVTAYLRAADPRSRARFTDALRSVVDTVQS